MTFQSRIELVQDDSRFHGDRRSFQVQINQAVQVFGDVDHKGQPDGLSALRSAGSSWQKRYTLFGRDCNHSLEIGLDLGHNHAHRLDLVN